MPAKGIMKRGIAVLIMLCLCIGAAAASADGEMPRMPEPPNTPVYWQLTSVEIEPEIKAAGGYVVTYETIGLTPDLDDALLTESQLEADDAAQGITLVVSRNDETLMEHTYLWTPLPVYLENVVDYPIHVAGTQVVGSNTPNSLLGIYTQGDLVARISAGNYTNHESSTTFDINTDVGVYKDGGLVLSFILRDVNDMFRTRIVYTYQMHDGARPTPTPIPGFAPVEVTDDVDVPSYYVPEADLDGVYHIITAPEEYRAYGSMSGSKPGFFPSDAEGDVVMNEAPVNPETDFESYVQGFVPEKPESVPDYYTDEENGIYSFTTRDGETVSRVYGRIDGGDPSFYAVEDDVIVRSDAEPVNPRDDYVNLIEGFGKSVPSAKETVPFYEKRTDDLYEFDDRQGDTHVRAYGCLNGDDPAYYEADAKGEVSKDAAPVDPDEDFDTFIKGFDATQPASVPKYYHDLGEGVYAVEGKNDETVYRVYGIKDGEDPAYYASDAEGDLLSENEKPVDPQDDFAKHIEGFEAEPIADVPEYYEQTEVDGVWAFVDKDGDSQYRVYGSLNQEDPAFYPSDAVGNVATDALPVDPASDLALMPVPAFTAVEPDEVPTHYIVVPEHSNVFSFTGRDGETVYRAYGTMRNSEDPAYYPSDENGKPETNAKPVDPEEEYNSHFSDFMVKTPPEGSVPPHYEIVEGKEGLYSFTDKFGNTVYRIFGDFPEAATEEGADETEEVTLEDLDVPQAYYPADSEGRIISGREVDPDEDLDLLPQVVRNSILTPAPKPEVETTPLARIRAAGATMWTDPTAPQPTQYIATISTQEPVAEGNATVGIMISPSPEATQEALPTTTATEATPTTAAPTEEAPAVTATVLEEVTEEATPTEAPAEEESSSSTTLWIVLAIAGVAVVGGGGYYLIRRNRKKSDGKK